MTRLHLLAAAALVALGALAWDVLRSPAADAPPLAPTAAGAAATSPPSPKAVSAMAGPAGAAPAGHILRPPSVSHATSSPLAREFRSSLAYKRLHDRLKATAEGETPEGRYLLYRILRACATVTDGRGGARNRTLSPSLIEERRQQIAASLPEGDPRRAQRLEAFEKVSTDPCAGLAGATVTQAELAKLLESAAAGGDPKAQAWRVEQEMWQERRSASTAGRAGSTLSDAQLEAMRSAVASRDPEAIAIAGRVLASSFRDLTVRIGPDGEPIENRTFMNAAQLLACEYGYGCDENNARVLNACAYEGHCGVASLPDYLFYYGASPYDAQLLDRYRTILRQAVDTGDWSGIVIDRGNRSPNVPSYGYHGILGGH